jgi:hypothetical protein
MGVSSAPRRIRVDLLEVGRDPDAVPLVFQLNKRDLPNILSVAEMTSVLTWGRCDYEETVATQGLGVPRALDRLLDLIASTRKLE